MNNQKGFTLMEMVVSVAIFVLTILSVTQIFIVITRLQRDLSSAQDLSADARFSFETMVRKVHDETIDYSYYVSQGIDLTQAVSVLAIRDRYGNKTVIRRSENGSGDALESCFLAVESEEFDRCTSDTPSEGIWQTMTSNETIVQNFALYIAPSLSPFELRADGSGLYEGENFQPRVTMILDVIREKFGDEDPPEFHLQTTAVSRFYQR